MDEDRKKSNREVNQKLFELYKNFLVKVREIEAKRDTEIARIFKEADREKAEKILKSIKEG